MPPNFCSHCGARYTPHPQSPLHCAQCGAQQITPPPTLRQQLDELTDRPWKPLTAQGYFEMAVAGGVMVFMGALFYYSTNWDLPPGGSFYLAGLWSVLGAVVLPAVVALIDWIYRSLGK